MDDESKTTMFGELMKMNVFSHLKDIIMFFDENDDSPVGNSPGIDVLSIKKINKLIVTRNISLVIT